MSHYDSHVQRQNISAVFERQGDKKVKILWLKTYAKRDRAFRRGQDIAVNACGFLTINFKFEICYNAQMDQQNGANKVSGDFMNYLNRSFQIIKIAGVVYYRLTVANERIRQLTVFTLLYETEAETAYYHTAF